MPRLPADPSSEPQALEARVASLEAGVKYLILGAVASAFMVFGIALVFGSAGTTNFEEIRSAQKALSVNPVFLVGLLLGYFAR